MWVVMVSHYLHDLHVSRGRESRGGGWSGCYGGCIEVMYMGKCWGGWSEVLSA